MAVMRDEVAQGSRFEAEDELNGRNGRAQAVRVNVKAD